MLKKIFLLFLTLVVGCLCDGNDDYYTVLVPGKLRPHSDHLITVTINAPQTDVTALIFAKLNNKTLASYEQTTKVKANETVVMALKIGELPNDGNFKLRVTGVGGINFTKETDLYLDGVHKLAFIQTDKAIYKPGQIVKFRIFIVDQQLRPLGNVSTNTIIKDSKENIIYSLKNTTEPNGLITGELQLSPEPLLGDWILSVSGDGISTDKKFKIDEYVLPTFDVEIRVPKLITKSTEKFVITVESKYTFGKPVKGELTLKITEAHYSYYRYSMDKEKRVEYLTDINGIAYIDIEKKDFLDENNFYDSKEYNVLASVRDYLTDKVYNKTKNFKVYNDKYKFRFLDGSKQFVPGFNYTAEIKITYPNDEILDTDEDVKVIYGFGYQDGKKRKIVTKSTNGIIRCNLNTTAFEAEPSVVTSKVNGTRKTIYIPTRDETSTIKVDVEFRNQTYLVGYVYKSSKNLKCYTHLRLNDETIEPKFKIGDEVEFIVNSLVPIEEFVYHVTNKNGIVISEKVKDSKTFKVKLTEDCSPKARVLVHFDCNGTLASDGIDLKVDGIIKQSVNIRTDLNETKPGKSIGINIDTKPDTTVALLGVDQKILLLQSGNDISKEDLVDGTEKHIGCKGENSFDSCAASNYYYWVDQPTPWEIRKSGFVVLSNKFNVRRDYLERPVPIAMSASAGLRGGARPLAASMPPPAPAPPGAAFDSQPETLAKTEFNSRTKVDNLRVRKEFPETWLWELVDTSSDGKASLNKIVPDSITSWVITGIGINQNDGLGLSNIANLNVLRNFFVKVSLPYSIIRGEVVAIEITVYNYFKTPQTTDVTMFNANDEFEFVNGSNSVEKKNEGQPEKQKTKQITIPANDGATLNFLITPKKIGHITIDVAAITDVAGDRINEKLLVKPEGETKYESKPLMISLNGDKIKRSVKIEMPENIVPESEQVNVDAVSDVLGQQINSLGDLLRIPYGCGEQNMINFVPNIVILDYLTKANKLTPKIKEKAISNMEIGYQRELTYKHDDGSYSAFGKSDKTGSTWLTAFVVKSFMQAKPYIQVDQSAIQKGFDFLRNKQNFDGSFREDGRVLSRAMQGGSPFETGSLTAYVVIALVNGMNLTGKDEMLNKAEKYLEDRMEKTKDNYETVIVAYALQLLNSPNKDKAFEKLNRIRREDKDFMYWSQNSTKANDESSIEMSSYALMTYIHRNQTENAMPILKYLISKQNSKGGFRSTQDTVIGIEALAKFATAFQFYDGELEIGLDTNEGAHFNLNVNKDNAVVLQQVILDRKTRSVDISANGKGTAFVRVSWQYNILTADQKPAFSLRHEYTETNSAVTINVCAKYLAGNESGMTLLEVTLPSGVVADLETFDDMKKSFAKRVETKSKDTVIVVYFDKITKDAEVCIPFIGNKVNKIANSKQMPIVIYDYYDRSKRMTSFYQPTQHSTCEICEDTDCDSSCQP